MSASYAQQTASRPDSKAQIEIIVPAIAKVAPENTKVFATLVLPAPAVQGREGGPIRHFDWDSPPNGLPSLFTDRRITRIEVARYIPGWDNQTPDVVWRKLFELTRRELEPPSGQIAWSEGSNWTIEATIEFSAGPPMRILTDGSHTCLIDDAGKQFFFESRP